MKRIFGKPKANVVDAPDFRKTFRDAVDIRLNEQVTIQKKNAGVISAKEADVILKKLKKDNLANNKKVIDTMAEFAKVSPDKVPLDLVDQISKAATLNDGTYIENIKKVIDADAFLDKNIDLKKVINDTVENIAENINSKLPSDSFLETINKKAKLATDDYMEVYDKYKKKLASDADMEIAQKKRKAIQDDILKQLDTDPYLRDKVVSKGMNWEMFGKILTSGILIAGAIGSMILLSEIAKNWTGCYLSTGGKEPVKLEGCSVWYSESPTDAEKEDGITNRGTLCACGTKSTDNTNKTVPDCSKLPKDQQNPYCLFVNDPKNKQYVCNFPNNKRLQCNNISDKTHPDAVYYYFETFTPFDVMNYVIEAAKDIIDDVGDGLFDFFKYIKWVGIGLGILILLFVIYKIYNFFDVSPTIPVQNSNPGFTVIPS
jgi:hypothetical protein